ncbi:MAG: glycosyltransferase [candidate division Zixibacteria bacterium]|nr:glycosyltransferase [candidate division Zixibacteria bacterium]
MRQKKVLIVSYLYPPMQAIGSYRILSFAKYLPKYGFRPHIISTVVNKRTWFGPLDKEAGTGEEVVRVGGAQLGALAKQIFDQRLSGFGISRGKFRSSQSSVLKRFLGFFYDEILTFPDPEWPWYWMGRKRALEATRKLEPDIILSSAPPFSSHLVAAYIQRKLRIPWIADYRDLWSKNYVRQRMRLVQAMESYLEKKTLRDCSAIITVSEPLRQDMRDFVDIPVYVVTNGFDPEDYQAIDGELPAGWETSRINAVYTGMWYPGKQDPTALFRALKILSKSGEIRPGELKVWLYGPNVHLLREKISAFSIEPFIGLEGPVARRQALNFQKLSDILVLLEWTDSAVKGVFTAKFFEYLGAGKPILAIGPSGGVVEQALKETGMGVVENDPLKLSKMIKNFVQRGVLKEDVGAHPIAPEQLRKFTREYQAGLLAEVLKSAMRENQK